MIAQNVNINSFVSVAWELLVNRFCLNKRIPPVSVDTSSTAQKTLWNRLYGSFPC